MAYYDHKYERDAAAILGNSGSSDDDGLGITDILDITDDIDTAGYDTTSYEEPSFLNLLRQRMLEEAMEKEESQAAYNSISCTKAYDYFLKNMESEADWTKGYRLDQFGNIVDENGSMQFNVRDEVVKEFNMKLANVTDEASYNDAMELYKYLGDFKDGRALDGLDVDYEIDPETGSIKDKAGNLIFEGENIEAAKQRADELGFDNPENTIEIDDDDTLDGPSVGKSDKESDEKSIDADEKKDDENKDKQAEAEDALSDINDKVARRDQKKAEAKEKAAQAKEKADSKAKLSEIYAKSQTDNRVEPKYNDFQTIRDKLVTNIYGSGIPKGERRFTYDDTVEMNQNQLGFVKVDEDDKRTPDEIRRQEDIDVDNYINRNYEALKDHMPWEAPGAYAANTRQTQQAQPVERQPLSNDAVYAQRVAEVAAYADGESIDDVWRRQVEASKNAEAEVEDAEVEVMDIDAEVAASVDNAESISVSDDDDLTLSDFDADMSVSSPEDEVKPERLAEVQQYLEPDASEDLQFYDITP